MARNPFEPYAAGDEVTYWHWSGKTVDAVVTDTGEVVRGAGQQVYIRTADGETFMTSENTLKLRQPSGRA